MKKEQSQIAIFTSSRAFRTFLPFLFLSYIIWSLNALAENQTDSIPIKIKYLNSPKNKLLIDKPNTLLYVEVTASGFNIMRHKILKKEVLIDLNQVHTKSDSIDYIQSSQFLSEIQQKLPNVMQAIRINPDTLFFKYKQLIAKEVPIHLKRKLSFQKGFGIIDSIILKPSTIKIYGTKNELAKINYVATNLLELQQINKNIYTKISLKQKENIRYEKDSITVLSFVDQMIEGKISLDFQLKNKESKDITFFPKKITLSYKAPLEVYKNLKPSDFKVVCDLSKAKNGGLTPELIKKPKQLKITSIKPETIQYIKE